MKHNHKLVEILKLADITVGGKKSQDITIHNPALFTRVIRDRELGLGETYMEGWWDSPRVDEFIAHIFLGGLDKKSNQAYLCSQLG